MKIIPPLLVFFTNKPPPLLVFFTNKPTYAPPLLVFFTNKPTYADNVSEHCSGKLIGIKFTETPVLPMCSLIKCRRVV